ncbi:MAG: hypothetical protein RLZZ417_2751 [Bacteroidota bacterium]|jgi:hypothetical protein
MIMRIPLFLILFFLNYLHGQTSGLISLNPAKTVKVVSVDLKDKYMDVEIYTKVKNISSDSISLKWNRRQPELPAGWISQVCDGITCFEDFVSTNIDTAKRINVPVKLKAGEEREFILHVFPVTKAGKGKIYIDLFSLKKPDSLLTTMEYDITINGLSTSSRNISEENAPIQLSPQPAFDFISIDHPFEELAHIQILNLLGQNMGVLEERKDHKYDISFLPPNTYLLKVQPRKGAPLTKIMLKAGN